MCPPNRRQERGKAAQKEVQVRAPIPDRPGVVPSKVLRAKSKVVSASKFPIVAGIVPIVGPAIVTTRSCLCAGRSTLGGVSDRVISGTETPQKYSCSRKGLPRGGPVPECVRKNPERWKSLWASIR